MTADSSPSAHVLICFDGSREAAHAIEEAARLLRGCRATVLYAWRSTPETTARFGAPAAWTAPEDIARDRAHARGVAEQGAELARTAGFDATATLAHGALPAWAVILEVARQIDPDAIVLGTRGLTGMRAMVLGSTSHHVVNVSERPTIVITMPAEDDHPAEAAANVSVEVEALD